MNDTWLTPLKLIKALGKFDMDPCCPPDMPWKTADIMLTETENGLLTPWQGRIWLNPPYSNPTEWLQRMAMHLNGTALLFARTDRRDYHELIFPVAQSILFMKGRIRFHKADGTKTMNGWAPSIFVAYSELDADALAQSGIPGEHILLKDQVFVINRLDYSDRTWKFIVGQAMEYVSKNAPWEKVYDMVERLAPVRVKSTRFFKEKVRQTVYLHYNSVS